LRSNSACDGDTAPTSLHERPPSSEYCHRPQLSPVVSTTAMPACAAVWLASAKPPRSDATVKPRGAGSSSLICVVGPLPESLGAELTRSGWLPSARSRRDRPLVTATVTVAVVCRVPPAHSS